MGLFDFTGKGKRRKEIDKIIEDSKGYLQQGAHYHAFVALKDIVFSKDETDRSYRRDEVEALYAESRKAARTDEIRNQAKKEAKDKAWQWYKAATSMGLSEGDALCAAAKYIDLGDEKPKDEAEAQRWQLYMEEVFSWYRKAAENGSIEGIIRCAVMYEKGIGTEMSRADAAYWYGAGAKRGNLECQMKSGNIYYFGKGMTRT